jgi:hypothetical protein
VSALPEREYREALAALRRAYASELAGRLRAVDRCAAAVCALGWDAERLQPLQDLAHRMAGSAGVYGFAAVSAAAAPLEAFAERALGWRGAPARGARHELGRLLRGLRRACVAEGLSARDTAPPPGGHGPPRPVPTRLRPAAS